MDIFETKNLSPMLIADNMPPFDSPDYYYELKLDGIRVVAYLDENGTELRNKRNKILNPYYPELKAIHKHVKSRCILDGELIVLREGKPDFSEVQRRSLMSDPFKIELAYKKLPVSFTAFDILYTGGKEVMSLPLSQRKELLADIVRESPQLAVSRHIESNGVAFFKAAAAQELEGIVAKKKGSLYYPGKRTKDWIKMKALIDEDFVVCGYYIKAENTVSVIIGSYSGVELVYQGHVVLGVSKRDFEIMRESAQANEYPNFPHFDGAIWLKPQLVCTVKYMERTKSEGLRQPVFKGLREDKHPQECTLRI